MLPSAEDIACSIAIRGESDALLAEAKLNSTACSAALHLSHTVLITRYATTPPRPMPRGKN